MMPRSSNQYPVQCSLCGDGEFEDRGDISQYVAGLTARVWQCLNCHSQSAILEGFNDDPNYAERLYDAIYRNSERLRGYDRYHRYLRIVRRSNRGMRNLALCEDVYWAVEESVRAFPKERPLRVMEVGSGLGYLTAALRSAGIEAYGVDISEVAVTRAAEEFGPWYSVANVLAEHDWPVPQPDLIIALELIEHLEDPGALIDQLTGRLPAHGQLLISTPNRDFSPMEAVWQTDLPPVHLQWISEKGLISLAHRTNCSIEFVDFSHYNRWSFGRRSKHALPRIQDPSLDLELHPIQPNNLIRERILSSRVAPMLQFSYRHIFGKPPENRQRSVSLVAKYSRGDVSEHHSL